MLCGLAQHVADSCFNLPRPPPTQHPHSGVRQIKGLHPHRSPPGGALGWQARLESNKHILSEIAASVEGSPTEPIHISAAVWLKLPRGHWLESNLRVGIEQVDTLISLEYTGILFYRDFTLLRLNSTTFSFHFGFIKTVYIFISLTFLWSCLAFVISFPVPSFLAFLLLDYVDIFAHICIPVLVWSELQGETKILKLKNLRPQDYANYSCIASVRNVCGIPDRSVIFRLTNKTGILWLF